LFKNPEILTVFNGISIAQSGCMKGSETSEKVMRGFLLVVALLLILAGGIETGSLVPRRPVISVKSN
jgi:hypothetical protein